MNKNEIDLRIEDFAGDIADLAKWVIGQIEGNEVAQNIAESIGLDQGIDGSTEESDDQLMVIEQRVLYAVIARMIREA